jgi:hypothetical protein
MPVARSTSRSSRRASVTSVSEVHPPLLALSETADSIRGLAEMC